MVNSAAATFSVRLFVLVPLLLQLANAYAPIYVSDDKFPDEFSTKVKLVHPRKHPNCKLSSIVVKPAGTVTVAKRVHP